MRTLLCLLALVAAPAVAGDREVRLRTECIGDRCALYEKGRRVGSVTNDGTGRLVVRDKRGRITAKILPDARGVRIKPR